MEISIHGPEDLGKYNSRPLITYEGNQGYCIYNILYLYLHQINKVLIIKNPLPMNTEELSNRLTQIVQGITNEQPNIIQGLIQCFIKDFVPDHDYVISITDVGGCETPMIGYYAWDEDEDGPIPGIKLFKDLNIYLEREFCEY